jgi:hypothetical protein
LIDLPQSIADKEFLLILEKLWSHGKVDLQEETQGDYLKYITKLRTKELHKHSYTDSILIDSLVLNNKCRDSAINLYKKYS